jgi:hypothetical protein
VPHVYMTRAEVIGIKVGLDLTPFVL